MSHHKPVRKDQLNAAIKRAIKLGIWFKLDPLKRTTLQLASKILNLLKSPTLIQLYEELMDLIHPSRKLLREAWEIGLKIVKKRVEQALMLGNKKAFKWLKDKKLILAYGLSYLNTPPFYRTIN